MPRSGDRLAVEPPGLPAHWQRLHTDGIRLPDHPLARNWPKRFPGDLQAYLRFDRVLDPLALLQRPDRAWVSAWPNAVLDQHALPYNFAAKIAWP